MDRHTIRMGQEFPREIQNAIIGASVMLVLIGNHWLDVGGSNSIQEPTDWVRREIEEGLKRSGLAIVPVLLEGARLPNEDELPASVRKLAFRNTATLPADDLRTEVTELVDEIQLGRISDLFAAGRTAPVLHLIGDEPRRFRINNEMVIGCGADVDIRIEHDHVARRHTIVWPVPEGVAIEDLGAAEGTLVNGTRIESTCRISKNSEIRIGNTTPAVELEGDRVQPTPVPS